MPERWNEDRIPGLEDLRPPPLPGSRRERLRQRILAAAAPLLARRRRPGTTWDVLAAWARPGLVAAVVVFALVAGSLLRREARPPLGSRLAPAETLPDDAGPAPLPALLVAAGEPDADAVVEAAFTVHTPNGDDAR